MPHPSSYRNRPLLFAAFVLAFTLAIATTASAAGFGELTRFGEPAPTVGKGEFFSGNGKIAPAFKRLLGVDTADNSVYVLEEPREAEEITSGPQEGEFKHWYRVQKFGPEAKFELQSQTFEIVTAVQEEDEEEYESEQDVQGIAIDPGAERLYFLVNEERAENRSDEEVETAGFLFELSTATLEGAPGTTNGVLADPTKLQTESKEAGKPLLEPRGIAVDPTTHEAIILAKVDVKAEKEYHWVLQRITAAGEFGERYVDATNFLQHNFKISGIEFSGGEPSSPVVTSDGSVLIEDNYHIEGNRSEGGQEVFFRERFRGIDEIPDFSKTTAPKVLIAEPEPQPPLGRVAESEGYPYGGSLSVSPEGTLYQRGNIENATHHVAKVGVLLRSATTGAVIGWTGGQAQSSTSDACVLEPGISEFPLPFVAAGAGGDLFVLAGEYLEPAGAGLEEFKTHAAIVELGPSGTGCPAASAGTLVAKEGLVAVTEPQQGQTVTLSVALTQADVLSATWVIEHEGTKEEIPFTGERLAESSIQHKFEQTGEYKVTAKIKTDDLAGPLEVEPSRSFKVKGEPTKPVVTEQPQSQTAPSGSVVTFKAAASGPPQTVEWLVSTDGGSTFHLDTTDPGHNEDVLKVTAAKAVNGYEYEAVFKNSKGEATTNPAKLTVEAAQAPHITEQPAAVVVTEGATATFKASAAGAPAPAVQWQLSSNGTTWTAIAGKTSTTLAIAGTTVAQSGTQYRAMFTNEVESVASSPATLTVTPAPSGGPGPGPGPGGDGGGVLGDTKVAPAAKIASAGAVTVSSSGALTLKVSCPANATCTGTVVLKTAAAVSARAGLARSAKKAILTLATGSFSLSGGQTKTIALHLSAKARKLLAKVHSLRVRATVAAHNPAGEKITTTAMLTLKRAKKKH